MWTCLVPGRGPPAANAWLTPASPGKPMRWSPGEVMPGSWTHGQPAAINERGLGWESGRSGYGGTTGPPWPGLPGRSGKLRKDGDPEGCRPIGYLTAAITRQGRRFRSSTGPWRQIGSPAAARRYLRGFRSGNLNGSCRRQSATDLTVFDTRAKAMVYAIPIPAMCPMFKMMDRRVSNGEPTGFIT